MVCQKKRTIKGYGSATSLVVARTWNYFVYTNNDITEILLKVVLNIITPPPPPTD
jgi:hypothetical protein